MKICSKCKEQKSLDNFYNNRGNKDGLEGSCKSCKDASNKTYNRDMTTYSREYYIRNKQKIDARQKERQLADKEAYLEYRRDYKKRYLSTYKGIMHNRRSSAKRRAARAAVASEKYDFLSICEAYSWMCCLCGGSIDKNLKWPDKQALTIEHIKPLALGGNDTADNVAPAHFGCNVSAAPSIRKMKAVQHV